MLTRTQRLDLILNNMKLLEDAEFYECALSHASYIKGMASAWYADGGITTEDWVDIRTAVEASMLQKYKMKSITQGVSL